MPTPEGESARSCTCYASYPAGARGCRGESECWVLREAREGQTPEGRERLRLAYHAELGKAQERAAAGPTFGDVAQWLAKVGVPGSVINDLRSPFPTVALETARRWWKADKGLTPALVLAGPFGCGKTLAAAWCAFEWAKGWDWNSRPTGDIVVAVVWVDNEQLTTIGGFDAASAALLDEARRARLLVIDDAGKEGTKRSIDALSDVVRSRVDSGRPTVITSNVTGPAFVARFGEALADRLRANAITADLRKEKSLRGRAGVRGVRHG